MSDSGLDLGLRHEPPTRQRRGRTVAAVLVALAVLVGAGAVGATGLRAVAHYLLRSAPDYSGAGSGSVIVQVQAGATATDIGRTLVRDGVVRSVAAFTDAADANARSRGIGPGYYRLRRHMKASLALGLLLDPASLVLSRVTIPEGLTVAAALHRIAAHTQVPLAQLVRAAGALSALPVPADCHGQLEGCLFPATYDVAPHSPASAVLAQLLQNFTSQAQRLGLDSGAAALHTSAFDVLIVASIAQREARSPADMAKVARVVYNRLARGMRLQLDSTVVYALHLTTGFVTDADTRTPSPYNTYLHVGLPPDPIDSPGAAALSAALHPAGGDWLYFVTVDKAGHDEFTDSYARFLQLKAQATAALR